jgi:hypothetical protein
MTRVVTYDGYRFTSSDDPEDVIGTVLSLLAHNYDRAELAARLAPGGRGAAIDAVGAVVPAPTRDWLPEPWDTDPAIDPETSELWVLTREPTHRSDTASQTVLTGDELRSLVARAVALLDAHAT